MECARPKPEKGQVVSRFEAKGHLVSKCLLRAALFSLASFQRKVLLCAGTPASTFACGQSKISRHYILLSLQSSARHRVLSAFSVYGRSQSLLHSRRYKTNHG